MLRRHWRLRIEDMLDAAETAVQLVGSLDREDFLNNRILVDAAIKNITVVGEAATRIPDEILRQWPEVPWREMRDMRNFIVHEYFGLSPDVLWGTLRDDLPTLIPLLRRVEQSEGGDPEG